MTSSLLAKGRFGKQDFVYVAADDVYLYPSGEQLTYHYTNEEDGKTRGGSTAWTQNGHWASQIWSRAALGPSWRFSEVPTRADDVSSIALQPGPASLVHCVTLQYV